MPIVRFFGRVLPTHCNLTYNDIPPVAKIVPAEGMTVTYTVNVTDSKVEVSCDASRFESTDITHLWVTAYDMARAAVDVLAFAEGLALTVILESFMDDTGTHKPVEPLAPHLHGICTAYTVDCHSQSDKEELLAFFRIAMNNPGLFMALNDLTYTLSNPHSAAINCGRVVEGLRKIVTPEKNIKKAWAFFQEQINADEAYLVFITNASIDPRHGDRTTIPPEISSELILRTWSVMNRFLEYKKRGSIPLALPLFPLLEG